MKDTKELRAFLVEQMKDTAEGKVTMEKAKSICNISQQIYNTLNVEIKMAIARQKVEADVIEPVSFQ
jgi:hypothetical protein